MSQFIKSSCVIILLLITVNSGQAQLTTTGPVRPPGVDEGIRPANRDQVIIPGVPYYLWQHGCGPTSVGMVLGYWDSHGCRFLVDGDASGQTASVNRMMAEDQGNTDCNNIFYSDHYHDYACPLDYFENILADKSELGGAHPDNCLADFMLTSRSIYGLMYGWSFNDMSAPSFIDYVNYVAPHYIKSAEMKWFGYDLTWEAYKAEIDAGRPMILHVDTDADNETDHMVTAIGYEERDGINFYGCHDTWDNKMHWYQWREMSYDYAWGIMSGVTFNCISIPKTIHVPGDYATIQEAVDHADELDTIIIADGIYTGPGNRDITIEGKPIIKSEHGPEYTIIDCQGSAENYHFGMYIDVDPGTEILIEGLTIRNAYNPNRGGGLYCLNSSPTILNCVFDNDYATKGGGLCIYGSSSSIVADCTIRHNAGSEGGGFYIGDYATPTINNCIIDNNNATYGGGIYNFASTPTYQNIIMSNNSADFGGGLYSNRGGGNIINSNICSNSAPNGAGIEISYNATTLVVQKSIIAFNINGQGIYCQNSKQVPPVFCSDIYGNANGDWVGDMAAQLSVNNNFSANPYFCDMIIGDYGLYSGSLCASANSPCGDIVGCFDVGCATEYVCGDTDGDGQIDVTDIAFLIDYYFNNGPRPVPYLAGDFTQNGFVGLTDIMLLNSFVFQTGEITCGN